MMNNDFSVPDPDGQRQYQTHFPDLHQQYIQQQQNITEHLLSTSDIIEKLKMKLKGYVELYDEETKKVDWKLESDKQIINDIGIHETLLFLDPLLSKEGRITRVEKHLVYNIYIKLKGDYIDIVFLNYDRWKLNPNSWKVLISTVGSVLFEYVNSVVDGKILQVLTPNVTETHQFIHQDRQSIGDRFRR